MNERRKNREEQHPPNFLLVFIHSIIGLFFLFFLTKLEEDKNVEIRSTV
jgi:hypothetical protein